MLQGVASDLDAYRFGPVYFDPPIVYAEPRPRGGPNAVEALFVEGIGSVYHPMSAGDHTLVLTTDSPFFGHFEVTYHITVKPPGRP